MTGPPGPRPSSKRGLFIGLGLASVVLIAGLVVGLVLLLTGDDGSETASDDPSTSESPSESPSESEPTEEPTDEPTDEPTEEPSEEPSSPASGTPEATADSFMRALLDGDCDAAEDLVTGNVLGAGGGCTEAQLPTETLEGFTYEVGTAEITGDTATVSVALILDLGQGPDDVPGSDLQLELVQEAGEWLVTDLGAPSMG